MPTFNGEDYIDQQLQSLVDQRNVRIDLFVLDDCSSDNTLSIADRYKKQLRLNVLVNSSNSGGTGLNILKNLSEHHSAIDPDDYDYFALCDQDDVWLPNKLNKAIEKMENRGCSLYCSNLLMWDGDTNEFIGEIVKSYPQKKFDYLFEGGSAGCTYVFTGEMLSLVRRRISAVPFDTLPRVSHDWWIYFIARTEGVGVYIDDNSYIKYRIHGSSQYGGLSVLSVRSIRDRLKWVREGFYLTQAKNSLYLVDKNSIEHSIYTKYIESRYGRLCVLLRYNFQLMRTKRKFLGFCVLSLFLVGVSKDH